MEDAKKRGVFGLVALFMLIGVAAVAPAQLPVVLFKASLVTLGVILAYWLDHLLFPWLQPHDEGLSDLLRAAVTIRRAVLALAVILGMGLAL